MLINILLTGLVLAGLVSAMMCYGVSTVELRERYKDAGVWRVGCEALPFILPPMIVFALYYIWS